MGKERRRSRRTPVREALLHGLANRLQALAGDPFDEETLRREILATHGPIDPVGDLLVRGLVYDWMIRSGRLSALRLVHLESGGFDLARNAQNRSERHGSTLVQRAQSMILNEYSSIRTVKSVAARLHCSDGHLNRAFQKAFGQSPFTYLRRTRVEQACRLLRNTDLKIEAIANIVGFKGRASLYRAFARENKLPPGAMR